jgi:hypothetical protein
MAWANQWVDNTQVQMVSTYQDNPTHFVWLYSGTVAECITANPSNPTLNFSEQAPAGKSLLAVLLTAVATQRNVNVQVSGCSIVEVYFK